MENKQAYGELLFPEIEQRVGTSQAGKVTGMILERYDMNELAKLKGDSKALSDSIREAQQALEEYRQKDLRKKKDRKREMTKSLEAAIEESTSNLKTTPKRNSDANEPANVILNSLEKVAIRSALGHQSHNGQNGSFSSYGMGSSRSETGSDTSEASFLSHGQTIKSQSNGSAIDEMEAKEEKVEVLVSEVGHEHSRPPQRLLIRHCLSLGDVCDSVREACDVPMYANIGIWNNRWESFVVIDESASIHSFKRRLQDNPQRLMLKLGVYGVRIPHVTLADNGELERSWDYMVILHALDGQEMTNSEKAPNAPRILQHPIFVTAGNADALKSKIYAKLPSKDKAWNNVTMSYWCNKWNSLLPLNEDAVMAEMPLRLRVFISVSSPGSFQRNGSYAQATKQRSASSIVTSLALGTDSCLSPQDRAPSAEPSSPSRAMEFSLFDHQSPSIGGLPMLSYSQNEQKKTNNNTLIQNGFISSPVPIQADSIVGSFPRDNSIYSLWG